MICFELFFFPDNLLKSWSPTTKRVVFFVTVFSTLHPISDASIEASLLGISNEPVKTKTSPNKFPSGFPSFEIDLSYDFAFDRIGLFTRINQSFIVFSFSLIAEIKICADAFASSKAS